MYHPEIMTVTEGTVIMVGLLLLFLGILYGGYRFQGRPEGSFRKYLGF